MKGVSSVEVSELPEALTRRWLLWRLKVAAVVGGGGLFFVCGSNTWASNASITFDILFWFCIFTYRKLRKIILHLRRVESIWICFQQPEYLHIQVVAETVHIFYSSVLTPAHQHYRIKIANSFSEFSLLILNT